MSIANLFAENDFNVNAKSVKVGSQYAGTAVLVAGTATVASSIVQDTDLIFLTGNNSGVTGALHISSVVPENEFVITSSNPADAGAVAWFIMPHD